MILFTPEQLVHVEEAARFLSTKQHPGYEYFTGRAPGARPFPKGKLLTRFMIEYNLFLAQFATWAYITAEKTPIQELKQSYFENAEEEAKGTVSNTEGHHLLYIKEMTQAWGYSPIFFPEDENIQLLPPKSRIYRNALDDVVRNGSWVEASAAVFTWVEGSSDDLQTLINHKLLPGEKKRTGSGNWMQRTGYVTEPSKLVLKAVHAKVEAGHRVEAYAMYQYIGRQEHEQVMAVLKKLQPLWYDSQTEIYELCGIESE